MPGPPSSEVPSPKRQVTVGSAVTLTVSPASEIDNDCRRGAGSSQNHDCAPVRPARMGLVLISPGASSTRCDSDCATADGDRRPAPSFEPGPTSVTHGVTLFGTYWHACPAASVYQKLPGPPGCRSFRIGELVESGGNGGGRFDAAPPRVLTVTTTACLLGAALRFCVSPDRADDS